MPNDKSPPEPETVAQQETGGGCQQEPCSPSLTPETDALFVGWRQTRGILDDARELAKKHERKSGVRQGVIRELEWSARYSYCTGWPCCPLCKGIKPGHGADEAGRLPDNRGHRQGCRLAEALSPENDPAQTVATSSNS